MENPDPGSQQEIKDFDLIKFLQKYEVALDALVSLLSPTYILKPEKKCRYALQELPNMEIKPCRCNYHNLSNIPIQICVD